MPVSEDWLRIMPGLFVLGSAIAILGLELVFRREVVRSKLDWVAYAGLFAAGAFVVGSRGHDAETAFGACIIADDLARLITIAVLAAAFLGILQSPAYVAQRGVWRAEFYALVLLSTGGMIFLVQANDLITMFLSVELLSLSIYVLTGITRRDRRSNEAAMKYFVQGAFATGFLLYGMAFLYGATGTLLLGEMGPRACGPAGVHPFALIGIGLLVAGFAFKLGAAPFHFWVPDVYEGAPTVVTAFMSVAVKAAGVGALARVLLGALGPAVDEWSGLMWAAAALTMIAGNLGAVTQRSVKRMLAYSSVAHTGYALVGLAAASGKGAAGASALFYVFVYTFMTLGAFAFLAWAGRAPSQAHPQGRDAEDIADLAGLARRRPYAAALMTIFMVSLAGIPPTAGFFGKFLLFKAAIENGFLWLAVIGILTSIVALYYYLRVVVYMYMHEPEVRTDEAGGAAGAADFNAGLAVVLSAALTLLFGVYPTQYWKLAQNAIEQLAR